MGIHIGNCQGGSHQICRTPHAGVTDDERADGGGAEMGFGTTTGKSGQGVKCFCPFLR